MRDVAGVAGVSLSTVSRVITGSVPVKPELAQRVRDAVDLLGYRPDATASTLRRADRVSLTIGLVFEDVANAFFQSVYRHVEDIARTRGVLTIVGSSDEDPDRERELTQAFLGRRVDGLVIAPAGRDQAYLTRDREAGVALVFVDRPPGFIDADVVMSDNAGGATDGVAEESPPPEATCCVRARTLHRHTGHGILVRVFRPSGGPGISCAGSGEHA